MRLKRLYSGLLALGLSCSVLFQTPVLAAEETAADTAQAATSAITTNSIPGWPQGPEITSTAAVIMEDSTQTMLYSKNMDQELYPGATVKVMTVLVALENSQLTDEVTMTETGVSGVTDGQWNNASMRSCSPQQMTSHFRLQNTLAVLLKTSFR